jgi:hypothetical protein
MVLSAIKWLAFLWGALPVGVMCYHAVRWFPYAADVRYNEMGMGLAIAAVYGWPSWLAIPAIAFAQRRELPRWQIMLLLSPVLAAGALYLSGQLLARGIL